MRSHAGILVMAALIVLSLLMSTLCYKVDELQDVVMISTFGRLDEPVWGRKPRPPYPGIEAPGLHFKAPWPFQRLIRYDARTFLFEDPYEQIQTRDDQTLMVASFCSWRIRDPRKFHTSVETVARGQEGIRTRLREHKGGVISRYRMGDLLNTDPAKMLLPQIEEGILQKLRQDVEDAYGVEVVGARIKVLGLPQQINTAVIEAQKKERETEVQKYKALGEAQAQAIREQAKSASVKITEFAKRKAEAIRSEGDRSAAQWYAKFEQNPELGMFIRSLEALRAGLKDNTVIWLDGTKLPAVRFFRDGPSLEPFKPAGPAAPEKPATAEKPAAPPEAAGRP